MCAAHLAAAVIVAALVTFAALLAWERRASP